MPERSEAESSVDAGANEPVERDGFHPPVSSKWRIFLAEDDAEMRRLVAGELRKEGYDVFEAADGGQLIVRLARTYAADHRPDQDVDLIVTDMRMPVCNGLDIVGILRNARWRTPIIIMTAFGDDAVRHRAHELGAVLLDKPFRMDFLKQTVRAILT